MSWMRLPEEYKGKDSEFLILPIPYEDNPTYGSGASKGPAEIIKASEHLEYYDEQFDCEPFVKGIKEMEEVTTLEKVQETVKGIGEEKFLL